MIQFAKSSGFFTHLQAVTPFCNFSTKVQLNFARPPFYSNDINHYSCHCFQDVAEILSEQVTARKMKFPIKDFFSKCDQTRGRLGLWSHLLKKSLTENLIFCTVSIYREMSQKLQRRIRACQTSVMELKIVKG